MNNNLSPDLERKHEKAIHAKRNAVTWVLLCDGGESKLFASQGDGKALVEIHDDKQDDEISKASEQIDSQATPADMREDKFIVSIAAKINSKENAFTRLVITAPPNALHALRNALSDGVQAKIIGELNKDLMHENASTLPRHIKQFFDVKDPNDYQQTGRGQMDAV
jgi:protein required for attachment to host cells